MVKDCLRFAWDRTTGSYRARSLPMLERYNCGRKKNQTYLSNKTCSGNCVGCVSCGAIIDPIAWTPQLSGENLSRWNRSCLIAKISIDRNTFSKLFEHQILMSLEIFKLKRLPPKRQSKKCVNSHFNKHRTEHCEPVRMPASSGSLRSSSVKLFNRGFGRRISWKGRVRRQSSA